MVTRPVEMFLGVGLNSNGNIPSGRATRVYSQPGSPGRSTCQLSFDRRARARPGSVANKRPESSRNASHNTAVFPSGVVKAVSSSGVNRSRVSAWVAGNACNLRARASERSRSISAGTGAGRGSPAPARNNAAVNKMRVSKLFNFIIYLKRYKPFPKSG